MQELVWLIVNDCDFEKAKKTQLFIRSPFLEMNYLLSNSDTDRFQREAIVRYIMKYLFKMNHNPRLINQIGKRNYP